jgi:hypothetical protein
LLLPMTMRPSLSRMSARSVDRASTAMISEDTWRQQTSKAGKHGSMLFALHAGLLTGNLCHRHDGFRLILGLTAWGMLSVRWLTLPGNCISPGPTTFTHCHNLGILTVMSNPVLRSWPRSSGPWPVVMARRKLQQGEEDSHGSPSHLACWTLMNAARGIKHATT